MKTVIKIIEHATGTPTAVDGEYLKSFDPFFNPDGRGLGKVEATTNIDEAMRFDDIVAAWEFWKQQSPTVPLRTGFDDKPNRPLTAFTITTEQVSDEPNTSTDAGRDQDGAWPPTCSAREGSTS